MTGADKMAEDEHLFPLPPCGKNASDRSSDLRVRSGCRRIGERKGAIKLREIPAARVVERRGLALGRVFVQRDLALPRVTECFVTGCQAFGKDRP